MVRAVSTTLLGANKTCSRNDALNCIPKIIERAFSFQKAKDCALLRVVVPTIPIAVDTKRFLWIDSDSGRSQIGDNIKSDGLETTNL